MGPILKLVQLPLSGIPSLYHINCTIHLDVVSKHAESALDPTVLVIEKDIKEQQSQDGALGNTTRHWLPSGRSAVGNNPLTMTIEPILYPANSPPFKSTSLQLKDKNVMLDHIKGLVEVQVYDISCFSFVHGSHRFIIGGHQIGQA